MRVTQSMLSNNMLRNLNTSYGKMSKLQDQLNSGKKVTRPSDDPVVAIKGMSYRTDIDKIKQFTRNMGETNNWLDTTDSTLGEAGDALNRVKELIVQAANDTNTADEREKIKAEIDQIRAQLQDLANTQVGSKYLFSGTNTQKPLYVDVEHFDPSEIEKHYTDLQAAVTAATNAVPEVPADVTNANNNFKKFRDVVEGTDQDALKVYLDGQNIKMTTSRLLNATYNVEENGTITQVNPFDAITISLSFSNPDKLENPNDQNSNLVPVAPTLVKLLPNPAEPTVTAGNEKVQIEVFDGIQFQVNTPGVEVFAKIDNFMEKVSDALKAGSETNNATDISDLLGGVINLNDPTAKGTNFSDIHGALLAARADVGAKQNRLEMMENRLAIQEVNVTKQMSNNEDVDYAKTITEMTTQESIHQAALSVGAKIIQQTLVDFMR